MNNVKKTVQMFWHYTRRYPLHVLGASTVIIQYLINIIVIPLLIGLSIGKLTAPDSVSFAYSTMLGLICMFVLIGIIINRISSMSMDRFEIAAAKDIHVAMAEHILSESYEFHSKSYSGALISQASRLAAAYVTFIDTILFEGLRTFIIVVVSSTVLAFYDLRLGMIMLVTTFLGLGTTTYMVRKRYPFQKEAIAKSSEQTAYFADMITNAVTVKTFAAENYEVNAYDKISEEAGQKTRIAWRKQINSNNITLLMVGIMNISILSYGIYAVQNGFLAPGIFIAAQLYAIRLSGAFWDTSRTIRALERVFADSHEMIEIMNTPISLTDKPGSIDLKVDQGALEFDNVSFHYNDTTSKDSVLKNFSLKLKPGEKVGLVGRSGGGKSTITKLVLRFMDVPSGSILIDNQNIAEVTQQSLRQAIAYVPQEPLLFHRSIAQNIGYGKPSVHKDEIIEAAKLAQAHDFIMSLPKQYDTEVGERGVKLSGGQRQRVAIARALLKDSPILVLDEATSALDSESEVEIQKALWKLMEKRTALVIAHRLSTVQKMDRIVVVDKGKIIEEGTHKQLLAKKGTYAELWQHQSGGFLED